MSDIHVHIHLHTQPTPTQSTETSTSNSGSEMNQVHSNPQETKFDRIEKTIKRSSALYDAVVNFISKF